ncbi:DNA helicase MCM9-like [Cottoperca gobio]|uniref:DNA helicase MCM9-like n=1 Tax=Cottoperca gobio TaxID=56716 RepID=A0A6J2P8E4_COTGO|nr:DNA helicase MCM9-like [Cottoperca gobio]
MGFLRRVAGLPACPELTRETIPRSRDVGHFLSVTGTVIRTSVAKVLEYERDYMCSKCSHVFTLQADFDQFYTFVPPAACPNPVVCNSYKFSCLSGGSEPAACRDFQEIKIQEQVQRLSVGSIPRSMVVVLEDDLVDSCKSGESHLLLVGDPGTGKSQFLKYAAKIMPRSVLTAGIGSTSAGLTVAAVKDGSDWHLEAGALVLSDGGLCCIDEFNSIKEHDRIKFLCKLNTRTTILAAANPKGQYDPNEPLSVNAALASPLLSRFDLVLVLLDTRNAEWDRIISSFILEDKGLPAECASLWSMEKIKTYFSLIKRLKPQVSEDANSILTRYYQLQRQSDSRNAARTTIRMLESLSRLAEAHAKLMYRETVTIEDAVMAVSVMECSMQGGALLGNVNALLTSFPDDPAQQYHVQCHVLLEGLNLPQLLQKEIDRQARLKSSTSQFDPPTDNYQHQLRDTKSINKTHCHDNTSNQGDVTVESGLDWFHSITSSSDGTASSIITSTQENLNRKPNSSWSEMSTVSKQPHCQTEKDFVSSADSSLNQDVVSNPFGTISSASEEKQRKSEKNENIKEKCTLKQSERRKDKEHPESLECVFQKVSKSLRDRRRELELSHHQCDEEGGGGHGERVVPGDVTDVVDTTLDSHTSNTLSSRKNCPSNNTSEDKRDQTPTKNISTTLKENQPAHWQTQKTKRKKRQNRYQSVSEGACSRQQVSCVSEAGESGSEASVCFTPKELDKDDFSFGKGEEQRTRDDVGDETKVCSFACTPPLKPNTCISDPATPKSGHTKSAVASSTLAKLSRFSFPCTTEPTTTAQTKVEKGPLKRDGAEGSRGSSKDEQTLNLPEYSPLLRKIKTAVTVGKVKDILPPAATELTPGQEHEQGTPTKAKHAELTRAATRMNDGPVDYQSSANLKKRKCFELGPPLSSVGGSKTPFSGLSMFGSELSNDVLDTDWDQEVSKKPKI